MGEVVGLDRETVRKPRRVVAEGLAGGEIGLIADLVEVRSRLAHDIDARRGDHVDGRARRDRPAVRVETVAYARLRRIDLDRVGVRVDERVERSGPPARLRGPHRVVVGVFGGFLVERLFGFLRLLSDHRRGEREQEG